jgi:hypothetical protein
MKVRTTIQPDREIEVDNAEYIDLKAMHLLVQENEPTGRTTAATEKEK